MAPTPTLDSFDPPLRYDVRPIGRLHAGGVLEPCGPSFPPVGPCLLVLWRPGGEPAFRVVAAALARGRGPTWRVEAAEPPPAEGWVVHWEPASVPGAPAEGS